jgi:hypothetical protein
MLDIALEHSNICNSIYMRGGSALDANSKVPFSRGLPISIPLAPDQWKVEARALFETSLARIQIDLKDHVLGAAANVNGFANHIDSAFTNMCASYKSRTVGWRNVNAWALKLLILLAVCVYVLSFETELWSEEPELIAESLWNYTVLRLLKKMSWVPAQPNGENDMIVQADIEGVEVAEDVDAGDVESQHVVGDDQEDK